MPAKSTAAKKATAKKSTKTSAPKIDVEFTFDRDTKNTRRFAEVVEGDATPVIGTLYVQKAAFKGGLPESITVTIHTN